MLNDEAFISEIKASGSSEGATNEFVEITIKKSADLSDYTLSFYKPSSGTLTGGYTGANPSAGSSFFPNLAEFTLADIAIQTGSVANPEGSVASSVSGLDLEIAQHPVHDDYWVIVIPFSGASSDTTNASVGAVALTNTDPTVNESIAYNIKNGSTAALSNGAAAGTNMIKTGGQPNSQYDRHGNIFTGLTPTPLFSVLCFDARVEIDIPDGVCFAGDLSEGDNVICQDGQSRPIRWIGINKVSREELENNPKLRPIRIISGALGNGLPRDDLLVSRQHRIVVRSAIAERMFGQPEVLVAAIKLTELPGIFIDTSVEEVTYVHLLFDQHEIVYANGALAESLFTGPEAQRVTGSQVWEDIKEQYPSVEFQADSEGIPARYIPQGKQQKRLIERHLKNRTPLFSGRGEHCGPNRLGSVHITPSKDGGRAICDSE